MLRSTICAKAASKAPPCLFRSASAVFPLIPAKAGIQGVAQTCEVCAGSRLRGDERRRDSPARLAVAPRLGVADDPRNGRKAPAQSALDAVDQIVRRAHRQGRIDPAMKVHDLAVGGFTHPHVVHFAEFGGRGRECRRILSTMS